MNFEDIDFPVGVPTTISIAYDDLSGGEASIVVTYKDHVDRPALGSELVEGSDAIWGFVEGVLLLSASPSRMYDGHGVILRD